MQPRPALVDAAAVLLFAGATAFVFARERSVPAPPPLEDEVAFRARVETVLPLLEAHVVAGSEKDRRAPGCPRDALVRTADIDAMARYVFESATAPEESLAAPLAAGIEAARTCVSCNDSNGSCAEAARAFTRVEDRLGWTHLPEGS